MPSIAKRFHMAIDLEQPKLTVVNTCLTLLRSQLYQGKRNRNLCDRFGISDHCHE